MYVVDCNKYRLPHKVTVVIQTRPTVGETKKIMAFA